MVKTEGFVGKMEELAGKWARSKGRINVKRRKDRDQRSETCMDES